MDMQQMVKWLEMTGQTRVGVVAEPTARFNPNAVLPDALKESLQLIRELRSRCAQAVRVPSIEQLHARSKNGLLPTLDTIWELSSKFDALGSESEDSITGNGPQRGLCTAKLGDMLKKLRVGFPGVNFEGLLPRNYFKFVPDMLEPLAWREVPRAPVQASTQAAIWALPHRVHRSDSRGDGATSAGPATCSEASPLKSAPVARAACATIAAPERTKPEAKAPEPVTAVVEAGRVASASAPTPAKGKAKRRLDKQPDGTLSIEGRAAKSWVSYEKALKEARLAAPSEDVTMHVLRNALKQFEAVHEMWSPRDRRLVGVDRASLDKMLARVCCGRASLRQRQPPRARSRRKAKTQRST